MTAELLIVFMLVTSLTTSITLVTASPQAAYVSGMHNRQAGANLPPGTNNTDGSLDSMFLMLGNVFRMIDASIDSLLNPKGSNNSASPLPRFNFFTSTYCTLMSAFGLPVNPNLCRNAKVMAAQKDQLFSSLMCMMMQSMSPPGQQPRCPPAPPATGQHVPIPNRIAASNITRERG